VIEILKVLFDLLLEIFRFQKKAAGQARAVAIDEALEKSKTGEVEDLQKEVGKLIK